MAENKQVFGVEGMSCAGCASEVQTTLNGIEGIKLANVNFANREAFIEFDEKKISVSEIKRIISDTGFVLNENIDFAEEDRKRQKYLKQLKYKTIAAFMFSTPVMVLSMIFHHNTDINYWLAALSIPVVVVFGGVFFKNAYKKALNRSASMDTLVATGTASALLFSLFNTFFPEFLLSRGIIPEIYYESATVIISFILLGRFFEEKAKYATNQAVRKLIELKPKTAVRIRENVEEIVDVQLLEYNDTVRIKPGDSIPADGELISGSGTVDESSMNGEPMPIEKIVGSRVIGGTINTSGSFLMKIDKLGKDTVLFKIIKAVHDAQGSKAPIEKITDRIAGIFVPIVILLALVISTLWLLSGTEQAIGMAFTSLINVLIIACPCALGLATPTAIMVGFGKAAKHGILLKSAETPEKISKIDTILLDKTGTITQGKPLLQQVEILGSEPEQNIILKHVINIERLSAHPLANSLTSDPRFENLELMEVKKFKNTEGYGLSAECEGINYLLGNKKLLKKNDISVSTEITDNSSVIYIAQNGVYCGYVTFADELKVGSMEAIAALKKYCTDIRIISGDRTEAVKNIAGKINLVQFKGDLLPTDKLAYLKELQQNGRNVLMAGDGVNDAPALAQANVGFAMSNGSDIAIETADVTIMHGDLKKIASAIKISKAVLRTIKVNLFWAFFYNLIAIPVAAGLPVLFGGPMLNPMIAGAAMAFSSVSVVYNSLLLNRIKL